MLTNIDEIASDEVQTPEDFISGDFCICKHKISKEHFKGDITGVDKCFGLTFNGTVWEACKCTQIKPIPYNISLMVPDHADNSQIRDSN